MKSDRAVWCFNGMWQLGVGSSYMYGFYTYHILDSLSPVPVSFTTVCFFIYFSILFFFHSAPPTFSFAIHTRHKYASAHTQIDTTCIQYQYSSELLASLVGIYFVCYFHALLSLTIHTYERFAIWNMFVDMCLSKTYILHRRYQVN